ncbi:hypothetical protein [Legionella nagasakiensis]|uniref:hypothetical protein n=1 Tax=Legionella nagasakiensis TaxID=535290 RepID=UPI00105564D0|nr:hypothetical protein [Legionella nagasakiensis]
MRIAGICGPFGSRTKQLAMLLEKAIADKTPVILIEEESFYKADLQLDIDRLLAAIREAEGIVIVVGQFLFEDAALRNALNIKVFMSEDKDSCLCNHLTAPRSQSVTLDSLLREYEEKLKPANDHRINPSQKHADIIVPSSTHFKVPLSLLLSAVTTIDQAPKLARSHSHGFF